MSKFKKKGGRGTQAINTAALPDIVFMLLFFFMVTTVMRDSSLKVTVKTPKATEIKKLEPKSLVSYIHIGKPIPPLIPSLGSSPRIQLNDDFATENDIATCVVQQRTALPMHKRNKMMVSLKVDKETNMGIVTKVKQKLRDADALKISYSAGKQSSQVSN